MRSSRGAKGVIIRSTRVLTERGLEPASVHIRDGVIKEIRAIDYQKIGMRLVDAGDDVVMPGLIDVHVHVNEPGRTEWEGFASATRAAAAGGITTICDMPLNSSPATTTTSALALKRHAARENAIINVEFIGGVVPGNARKLEFLREAGITLFKCFLVPSGVEEFPAVSETELRVAMPILAKLGATLLVHAELPEHIGLPSGYPRSYASYLASRPDVAETSAVEMIIRLAGEYGTRVHIVHVSSASTIPLIREARARGVAITCETCPHYLTFSAEWIEDGATEMKCAPPIRDAETREALWRGLIAGDIDLIASDHSPCPPELKRTDGDFFQAWGGIASLQLGLPAVWHEAQSRGATIEQVAGWMSAAPARLAGLASSRGRIAVGYDADIVIWKPETRVDVNAMTLYHRHPVTPYRNCILTGEVHSTYVRGVEIFPSFTAQ